MLLKRWSSLAELLKELPRWFLAGEAAKQWVKLFPSAYERWLMNLNLL